MMWAWLKLDAHVISRVNCCLSLDDARSRRDLMRTEERSSLGLSPLASPRYTGPKLVSHKSLNRQMFPLGYSSCFSRFLAGRHRKVSVLSLLARVVDRVGGAGLSRASWTSDACIMSVPEDCLRSCLSARELMGYGISTWLGFLLGCVEDLVGLFVGSFLFLKLEKLRRKRAPTVRKMIKTKMRLAATATAMMLDGTDEEVG